MAYIADKRAMREHPPSLEPEVYQPRVGTAQRIAGSIGHTLSGGGLIRNFRGRTSK